MKGLLSLFIVLFTANSWSQNVKEYDLYVSDTIVNYTGKKVNGIAINGSIPAPTPVSYTHLTLPTKA